MTFSFFRCAVFFLLLTSFSKTFSQEEEPVKKFRQYKRTFQFSLFPGISSNGTSSGFYFNKFSFNLFGGLSGGNRGVELGLITNSNVLSVAGIQLGGLANIVGANTFLNLTLSEERSLIHDDYESNVQGIQVAGLLNYVRNNASAFQLSGGLNVVDENVEGFQIAGIGNSAGGFVAGFQLAGLYNLSGESVGGFQISTLFNYTEMQLSGLQIGMINKAQIIKGRKSTPPQRTRGLQIGLLNFSKEMDGMQIGLINFGGATRGKQIGLINFFNRLPIKEYEMMGTPIGLLNFGTNGSYMRIFYNELFPINLEYTTGNCQNGSWTQSGMPFFQNNLKFNQNVLIAGYDWMNDMWGFGYGFQKMLYNKATMLPKPTNEKRVMNYGIKFIHLNRMKKLDRAFNLLSRVNFDYGKRYKGMYFFCGVSLNYFLYTNENEMAYRINSVRINSGKPLWFNSDVWPGYSVGVQLL